MTTVSTHEENTLNNQNYNVNETVNVVLVFPYFNSEKE